MSFITPRDDKDKDPNLPYTPPTPTEEQEVAFGKDEEQKNNPTVSSAEVTQNQPLDESGNPPQGLPVTVNPEPLRRTGVSTPRQAPQGRRRYTSSDVERRLEGELDKYLRRKNLTVVPAPQNTQQRGVDPFQASVPVEEQEKEVAEQTAEQDSEHSDSVESLIQSVRTLSLLTEANRTLDEADAKSREDHGTQAPAPYLNNGYPAAANLISLTTLNMAKLSEITGPKVEEFLHEFKAFRSTVANADVRSYLSINATKALRTRNVDMSRSAHVLKYLEHFARRHSRSNKKTALKRLKDKLRWPSKELGLDDQVNTFFDNAKIILADLNTEERKANEKTIAKIIIDKLPKKLRITKDMLNTKPKLKQLKYLEKLANNRNWSLEDEGGVSHQPMEHKKTRVKKLSCNKISDKKILEIQVLCKDKATNQFKMVHGCPDTGTLRNIGSYSLMKPFILKEENPRMITHITFPDDSFIPVYKVARIHIMLQKGEKKKDLGTQLVFLTNDQNWKDLLIGKKTLDAHGIQLAFDTNKQH
eukprot:snap_masked-scaffold_13-processed-gene-10.42-mRNA-1 protein AED:1.00 eAED:1.00 QI:0/-1/0/0/-1/1/1/0/529